jgi:hypothetical protein
MERLKRLEGKVEECKGKMEDLKDWRRTQKKGWND